ncbi:MAG: shikimate kinase [Anaerovoracaceae bacterium]|nr:shikimate kinase [Anaerovoracaceae bacterium]
MKKTMPSKKAYGLIGKTLAHSYSREIHQALGEYSFDLWELGPEEVAEFLRCRDFSGAMVTIPYKKEALAAADQVTPQAKKIGAANILYFDEGGQLWADNTDYWGFMYMVGRMGLSFKGKDVLILGDGATSGTLCQAVMDLQAASIKIASRHPERYKGDSPKGKNKVFGCEDLGQEPIVLGYDEDFSDSQIIINTTSVGMYPNNGEKLISLEKTSSLEAVIDLIYNPFATALLLEAQDLGIKTSNGFPMLVAQATKGGELFLRGVLPQGKSWEEWNEILITRFEEEYINRVLIGMPGSGKTTIGKEWAEKLNRVFVDTDRLIVEREGQSISDIFELKGEAYFRSLEVEIAKEIGKLRSQVIASGGGMVLQKEVMDALRQNGEIIWVKAPLENLELKGRPLSGGIRELEEMWEEREPLYNKYADKIINRDGES